MASSNDKMVDDERSADVIKRPLDVLHHHLATTLANIARLKSKRDMSEEVARFKAEVGHLWASRPYLQYMHELVESGLSLASLPRCDACRKYLGMCECEYDENLQAIQTLFM